MKSTELFALYLWHYKICSQEKIIKILREDFDKAYDSAAVGLLPSKHTVLELGEEVLGYYADRDVDISLFADKNYPQKLTQLKSPPPVLCLRGDRSLLDRNAVAVVGTRKASERSANVTRYLTDLVSENDYVVVSGGAKGIDAAAHRECMLHQWPTIAVSATGLDIAYPNDNRDIYDYCRNNGLIVSRFPMHAPAKKSHFPIRNEIIAALSQKCFVIQAGSDSGALYTANYARRLNIPVYILGCDVLEGDTYDGGLALARKNQATLLSCNADLVKLFERHAQRNLPLFNPEDARKSGAREIAFEGLMYEIFSMIEKYEPFEEDLCDICPDGAQRALILRQLEIDGYIGFSFDGRYRVCKT